MNGKVDIKRVNLLTVKDYNNLSEEEQSDVKGYVRVCLSNNICNVTFTKANGDIRSSECTTSFDIIPEIYHPKQDLSDQSSVRKYDPEQSCVIFDIKSNGWRSFRFDRLIQLECPIDEEPF